jgi:prepilin-type N-terminal cleavage/methylation domain-containing protein
MMLAKTRKRKRAQKTRGFTLIELMAAMAVLSLGLFSIIHLQVVTVRGHSYARQRTEATLIAMQAGEELRKESQEWVNGMQTGPVDIVSVFPKIAPQIVPTPTGTGQLAFTDLRALENFNGRQIASGPAVDNAWRINSQGFSPDSGTATAQQALGAIYRVHYVAYYAAPPPLAPPIDLLQVTIFVSWDNKDAGQSYDWAQWAASAANFWSRHMVVMPFYLPRSRRW